MAIFNRALIVAGAAGLLCAFAPAGQEIRLDGHLPARTAVNYSFVCEGGSIDIGYSQQLSAEAPADRFRTLQLLAFLQSGRAVSAESFADIARLVQSYEWIEGVSAQCEPSATLVTVRGVRKADWQAHIAALEAHDDAPVGTVRPDRPATRATDIRISSSGAVEIKG